MILPYVYLLTHRNTQQFYFGYRERNIVSSSFDLGITYFTSSKYIKNLGFENFEIQILAEFFKPKNAYDYEQTLIKEHRKNILCLNRHFTNGKQFRYIRQIGTYKTSEETKKKQSLAHKGKIKTEETKIKLSNALKGRIVSEETKAKISIAGKGRIVSEETRAKISKSGKGLSRPPVSDETRKKMSQAKKLQIYSPRGPMSEGIKEKIRQKSLNMSSETKAKMKESSRKRWDRQKGS